MVKNEEEVKQNWETLKLKEREKKVFLEGVPKSLPAVGKGESRIQDKVAGVGFDWEEPQQVFEKVKEELGRASDDEISEDNAAIKSKQSLEMCYFQ